MPRIPVSLVDAKHTKPIGPAMIIRTAAKLRAGGVTVSAAPIVVERHGGRYRLLRGLRRFLVAQTEGDAEIEAIIKRSRRGKV